MPDSPDLLRDAEVLRKLLTECLRRVDRLEQWLRADAATDEPASAPRTDPFEQALPDRDERPADAGAGTTAPRPRAQAPSRPKDADISSIVRTLHLSPARLHESDDPDGAHSPASPRAPESRRTRTPRDADWDAGPPSGDGTLDPFALLDMSVPPPEPDDAEIYRGMSALLGGLDVTTPGDDA